MRGAVAGAAGLALLALGLGAGMAVVPGGPYVGEPAGESGARTVEVARQPFDDPVPVGLEPVAEPERVLASPLSGTITATSCRPGVVLSSGTVLLRIDDVAVGLLHTRTPLWRDLAVGVKGPDVAAVTEELRRLGAKVERTASLDVDTARAVRTFLQEKGLLPAGAGGLWRGRTVLPRAALVWLPQPSATVEACKALTGDTVAGGAPLVALAPATPAVRVLLRGAPRLAGARDLRMGEVRIAAPDGDVVTDPAAIRAVLASPAGRQHAEAGGTGVIAAESVLRQPQDVAAIPPGALLGVTGDTACVQAEDGGQVAVRLLATTLGQVLVQAAPGSADLPPQVRLDLDGALRCR